LAAAFDEQYERIPNNEITLLARKFHASHKFFKEQRRSPRDCFECSNTTHFIVDYPKRKKLAPPTSMTTPTGMTIARVTTRRRTASGRTTTTTTTTTTTRSSRRSCPERVLP
jgi:hypothetical protein